MKTKIFFAIVSLLSLLTACDNNYDYLDADISISYKSSEGTDLLNESNPGSIKSEDIDIYYLINGTKIRVYDDMMDYPENFRIEYSESKKIFLLTVYLNDNYDANILSETIIEFGNRADTIKAEWHVNSDKSSQYYLKIWYDNVLKISDSSEEFFEVTLE